MYYAAVRKSSNSKHKFICEANLLWIHPRKDEGAESLPFFYQSKKILVRK